MQRDGGGGSGRSIAVKLQEARDKGVGELYLRGGVLQRLTSKIVEARDKGVGELYLRGGVLQRLDASHIPDVLQHCTSLRKLDLSCNAMAYIPTCVLALTQLEELKVHSNSLSAVSDDIVALVRLQRLRLENNKIRSLPHDLSGLVALRDLNLSHNHLDHVPVASLATLPSLTALNLSHNAISKLDDDVALLSSSLTALDISNNHLRALPLGLARLTLLRRLQASLNELDDLPDDACRGLVALVHLDLRYNRLARLPPSLALLSNLSDLLLEGNPLESSLPRNYQKLPLPETLARLHDTQKSGWRLSSRLSASLSSSRDHIIRSTYPPEKTSPSPSSTPSSNAAAATATASSSASSASSSSTLLAPPPGSFLSASSPALGTPATPSSSSSATLDPRPPHEAKASAIMTLGILFPNRKKDELEQAYESAGTVQGAVAELSAITNVTLSPVVARPPADPAPPPPPSSLATAVAKDPSPSPSAGALSSNKLSSSTAAPATATSSPSLSSSSSSTLSFLPHSFSIKKRSGQVLNRVINFKPAAALRQSQIFSASDAQVYAYGDQQQQQQQQQQLPPQQQPQQQRAPIDIGAQRPAGDVLSRMLHVEATSNKLLLALQQDEQLSDLFELVVQGSVRALAPPNIGLGGVKITRNLVKAHLIVLDSNAPSTFTSLAGRCGTINYEKQTLSLVTTLKRKRVERKEIVLDILGYGPTTIGNAGSIMLTIISDPMVDIEHWVDDNEEYDSRLASSPEYETMTDRSLEAFFLMNPGKRKKIKAFMEKFAKQWKKQDSRSHEATAHAELRDRLQQFVNKTTSWIVSHPFWTDPPLTEPEYDMLKADVRKNAQLAIYNLVFARGLDRLEDDRLSRKLDKLRSFIDCTQHLDLPPFFRNQEVWKEAGELLVAIDELTSTQEKLICILSCCKAAYRALGLYQQQSSSSSSSSSEAGASSSSTQIGAARSVVGVEVGADQFLPLLILIVIHSGIRTLHSNLQYIDKFSDESSEMTGEVAYYFTQLYSVASFIRDMKASDINMNPDEFDRLMADSDSVSEPRLGDLFSFVDSALEDITMEDIPLLLEQYKRLAAIVSASDGSGSAAASSLPNREAPVSPRGAPTPIAPSPNSKPTTSRIVLVRLAGSQSTFQLMRLPDGTTYDGLCTLVQRKFSNTSPVTITQPPYLTIRDNEDVDLIVDRAELEVTFTA